MNAVLEAERLPEMARQTRKALEDVWYEDDTLRITGARMLISIWHFLLCWPAPQTVLQLIMVLISGFILLT